MNGLGLSGDRLGLWERQSTPFNIDLVHTGVGKANASGAIARVLDPERHLGVLSVGIAGALPGSGCNLGDVVCGSSSVFADEGVSTPEGFVSCAAMGFAPFNTGSDAIEHDPGVLGWLGCVSGHQGPIATVSSCSGTDACAASIVERTGAIAEAMEGAAAAMAAKRIDPTMRTGELRVVSNTTGDRDGQRWDLDGALDAMGCVLGRIAGGLR